MDTDSAAASRAPLLPIVLASVATALWCYSFAKAGLTSITHDEASTYFHHFNSGFFNCLYSPDCWKSANNHLLNTLFWQQTIQWFGPTELGMRLPNVLAHLVFLASSASIVLRFTARLLPGLAAFAVLNFNPYLLDFFALARGYGLCAAFVMAALALWLGYWQHRKLSRLALCCAALTAAILSNFVALNIFLAIAGATFLLTLKGERRFFLRSTALLGGTALLLALILHRPIRFLRQGGEFQYGTGSLWESLESMVKNMLYGHLYIGDLTLPILAGLTYAAVLGAAGFAFVRFRDNRHSGRDSFFAGLCLAFLLSIVGMIAQHHLLGSVYLVNRTAGPLTVLLSAVLAVGLLLASDSRRRRVALAASALVLFALSWNLLRAGNVRYFREWWYDENTKAVMLYMNDVGGAQQKTVRIGVSWLFYPSAEFYRVTLGLQHVAQVPNDPDVRKDAGYDYYYIEESSRDVLGEMYLQEKYFPWGRVLMRKKSLAE
jgi:hypothetical protein